MFRKAIAALFMVVLGGCSPQTRERSPQVKLIAFNVAGVEPFSGVLAVSDNPISRKDALRFESAIRGFVFVQGDPPSNLNACFYIDDKRFGLTHIEMSTPSSFRFDLERFPDAGVAYTFQVAADGSVSGKGGFWGASDDIGAAQSGLLVGTYRLVANFDECTNKFPANET